LKTYHNLRLFVT